MKSWNARSRLAKQFNTDKVRCFDFWRLEDVAPYRAGDRREAAVNCGDVAASKGILLVLENEFACNTATGREAARTMNAIQTPHLALNWDPGNAVMRGELDAFPVAWEMIPKDRIHHCHCKNAIKGAGGKIEWSPVDKGYIDWAAQFRALKQMGYHDAVSLETHWHGGGTPEESTRISWAGMKQALRKRPGRLALEIHSTHAKIECVPAAEGEDDGYPTGISRHARSGRRRHGNRIRPPRVTARSWAPMTV